MRAHSWVNREFNPEHKKLCWAFQVVALSNLNLGFRWWYLSFSTTGGFCTLGNLLGRISLTLNESFIRRRETFNTRPRGAGLLDSPGVHLLALLKSYNDMSMVCWGAFHPGTLADGVEFERRLFHSTFSTVRAHAAAAQQAGQRVLCSAVLSVQTRGNMPAECTMTSQTRPYY